MCVAIVQAVEYVAGLLVFQYGLQHHVQVCPGVKEDGGRKGGGGGLSGREGWLGIGEGTCCTCCCVVMGWVAFGSFRVLVLWAPLRF